MIRPLLWPWFRSGTPKLTCRASVRISVEQLEERVTPNAHTWNGASGSGVWSNPANWSAGGAVTNGETNVQLTFPAGIVNTIAINDVPNVDLHIITFDPASPAYVINLIGPGTTALFGLQIQNNGTNSQMINGTGVNLTSGSSSFFTSNSGAIIVGVALTGAPPERGFRWLRHPEQRRQQL